MQLEARAKINWTLDITGQRDDGYHLMDMLMQPVSLCDTVTLAPSDVLTLTTGGFPLLPPSEDHLALRAARALQAATGCTKGSSIDVFKRIPVGAGMGGGSADAAAVLWGLNKLWHIGLSADELEAIGLTLGADVPFCLRGGLCRAEGIGEVLTSLPCPKHYWLAVVQPCRGLSTKEVFTAYHAREDTAHPDTELALRALTEGDTALLGRVLGNVLQPVSEALRPELHQAVDALSACGAVAALMTGSGSAVFGVFRTAALARNAAARLRTRWRGAWMCHTCTDSVVRL